MSSKPTTATGGRRSSKNGTRKSKTGGSAMTPAPVKGGSALTPAPVKGGSALTPAPVKGGSALTPAPVKGGNAVMPEPVDNESKGVEPAPTVGGKKSGACDKAYCVKCKKKNTPMINCKNATSKNGRNMVKGVCKKCGTKMNKFV